MSVEFIIENEIKIMKNSYKMEITRIEFQISMLTYKIWEINALLNKDNLNKMKQVNEIDINDSTAIQRILKESLNIKLLNEYLDETKRELTLVQCELDVKRSFYERIKKHVYETCEHLWISDHFENPALMCMVGCTYCNVCGLTRDDI